jgi:hypothetical protein
MGNTKKIKIYNKKKIFIKFVLLINIHIIYN